MLKRGNSHFGIHLMEYKMVPSCLILSSLLGVVTVWTYDPLPLWKYVSGFHIRSNILMWTAISCIGPTNCSRLSIHVWRKYASNEKVLKRVIYQLVPLNLRFLLFVNKQFRTIKYYNRNLSAEWKFVLRHNATALFLLTRERECLNKFLMTDTRL